MDANHHNHHQQQLPLRPPPSPQLATTTTTTCNNSYHHQQQQPSWTQPTGSCPDETYAVNERPCHSRMKAVSQSVDGRVQHSQQPRGAGTDKSKLLSMNPYSRSSQLITLALKKKNECEHDERNESVSDECDDNKGCDNVHDGNKCGNNESLEFDLSASNFLQITNVDSHDYDANASFSEYIYPTQPAKVNILKTGNIMTNVRATDFHPRTVGEYLDLSTGQVNVVCGDSRNDGSNDENDLSQLDESVVEMQPESQRIQCLREEEDREIESALPTVTPECPSPDIAEHLAVENESERDETEIDPIIERSEDPLQVDATENERDDVIAGMEAIHREHGTKKRKGNPEAWQRKINKKRRESGKEYVGRKYTSKDEFVLENKAAKFLGNRCECKTSFTNCGDLSDEDRQNIFGTVWKLDWPGKKHFVSAMTYKKTVSKRTTKDADSSRRSDTIVYMLKAIDDKRVRVCKKMFLSTTGLKDYFVRTYADLKDVGTANDSSQKKPCPGRVSVMRFLQTLPVLPSHYCRKDSSKLYLEPVFQSDTDVFTLYKQYCTEHDLTAAGRTVFMDEFNANNYARFHPRKDQCDECTQHKEGNLSDELYARHLANKDSSRAEMEADIELAKNSNGSLKVVTMDLQCVLLCPSLKASALYYRSKLCVHNFTLYDCVSADVKCYVWHEAEGGVIFQ